MERLYFDYNASAPVAAGLPEQIATWLKTDFKNPSSSHQEGQSAKAIIEKSRKTTLRLLGAAEGDKLFFTSGGTESNNSVLHSAFLNRGARKKLLLTRIEHSCVYNYARFLETQGAELVWIDVDRHGRVDLEAYEKQLTSDVFLMCAMLVNNETGFILPIADIAARARTKGIQSHCDVVCAAGKIPLSFSELGVDSITFSSHKFGGLKGCGGVIFKSGAKISSYLIGGPQEVEKRAGTQNVIGIAASAYALESWLSALPEELGSEAILRERLKQRILEAYPRAAFLESTHNTLQTLSTIFKGLNGNVLLTALDLEGVAASYGSACASGSLEVSRVIKELGLQFDEARATIRLSFGHGITAQHIDEFGRRLARVVQKMQS